MPDTIISNLDTTDMTNAVQDYSVDSETTDGPSESKETEYTNADWTQQLGYYKNIPEIQAVIDAKATWTVGKGYNADESAVLMEMLNVGDSIEREGRKTVAQYEKALAKRKWSLEL